MVLFRLKRTAPRALAAAAVVAAVSLFLRAALDLSWTLHLGVGTVALGVVGVGLVGIVDGTIHVAATAVWGDRYLAAYDDAVSVLDGQSPAAMAASGVLAAAEELFFRGVILLGSLSLLHLPPAVAVLLAAVPFGLLHVLPGRARVPFWLWSIWQGIAFGALYVLTGSLAVVAIAHCLHDVGGSIAFAYRRRQSNRSDSPE